MYAMDSGNKSDDEHMPTEMLEDIRDRSQSHPNVNNIEARYKIHDHINQRQPEWKGALKATQNMGKGLQKRFRMIYHLWVNLVQKFPISFQNLETFSKLPNFQMT